MRVDNEGRTSKIALVIGAGSVKCAAALGLQRAFERKGIDFDLVVGCSGGALYAARIAMGFTVEETVAATRELWTREVTSVPNRSSLIKALMPKWFGFSEEWGLRDDRLILQRLQEAYGDTRLSSAKIPLYITATDFRTGEQVVLDNCRIVDAIRASLAIPFIFKPWKVGDRLLADGFLSDPLPIGVAIREGADVIIAMGFESPYQKRINSAARFGFQISTIMTNNLLRSNFAFHSLAHHSEVIPIIPEFEQRIRLFDTDKIPYIIDEGEKAAELQLPYILNLLRAEGGNDDSLGSALD
jgi:NTE family protein